MDVHFTGYTVRPRSLTGNIPGELKNMQRNSCQGSDTLWILYDEDLRNCAGKYLTFNAITPSPLITQSQSF